tara:strand:- start:14412 stop:18347 length:3936 start_codon:yes stop_codon:yes gene_type:complete
MWGGVEGDTVSPIQAVTFKAAGTLRTPSVHIPTNTLSGSFRVYLIVNNQFTTCNFVVASGVTGWYEDATVAWDFSSGDTAYWLYVTDSGSGSININKIQAEYDTSLSSQTLSLAGINQAGSTNLNAGSAVYYLPIQGSRQEDSESLVTQHIPTAGVWHNLEASTGTCSRSTSVVVTLRKNLADSIATISFGGSDTNTKRIDASNTVSFAAGDSASYKIQNGSGSGSFNWEKIGGNFITADGKFFLSSGDDGSSNIGDGTYYWPIMGQCFSSSETNQGMRVPTNGEFNVEKLFTTIALNGNSGTVVLTLRKNGVDTGLTATVTSGAVGYFDGTGSVSFAAGDILTVKSVHVGGGASLTKVNQVGIVATSTGTGGATPIPWSPAPTGLVRTLKKQNTQGSNTSESVTVYTPELQENVHVGSLLVATIAIRAGGDSFTTPTGWTLLETTNEGGFFGNATYWRIADRSAADDFSITWTDGGRASIMIQEYGSAGGTFTLDGSDKTNGTSSNTKTPPAVSASTSSGIAVAILHSFNQSSWGTLAANITEPTGYTDFDEGYAASSRPYTAMGSKELTSASSEAPGWSTSASGGNSWAAVGVFTLAAGGAVTVSGTVQAQDASTSGTATAVSPAVPVTVSGAVQAQDASTSGVVGSDTIVSVSGAVQAQAATTTGTIGSDSIVSASGAVQAQPASTSGVVGSDTIVSVSGTVQAQVATTSGTVAIEGAAVTVSGSVQAQPASTSGTVGAETIVSVSGAVQAQVATTSGTIGSQTVVTLSGAVQAQVATTSGTVGSDTIVTINGTVQAQPASTSGTVTAKALIAASGSVQAQNATTSGVAIVPVEGLFALKIKVGPDSWIDVVDFTHRADLANPHQTPLGGLTDVTLTATLDGQTLRYDNAAGLWKQSNVLIIKETKSVDLALGDYLYDDREMGKWNGLLGEDFYIIGDSLTSPNGGTLGTITYDTDGAGAITNAAISVAGSGYTRNFQASVRGDNNAMAWFDIVIVAGAMSTITFTHQSIPFGFSLVGESSNTATATPLNSWAYLLWNEYALGANSHIDAMPATSIARPGTTYQVNAPAALHAGHIMLVCLGGNDAGGIEVPPTGLGPGGQAFDITEAQFKAAFQALLQDGITKGYRVIVGLTAYNNINLISDDDTWITATTLIKQYQRDVCAILGLTEIWDYNVSNMTDYLHPDQSGHNIFRREMYPRMVGASTSASSGGGATLTGIKTTTYTATAGDKVPCDTSGGAFTLSLPASPSVGDEVLFFDYGQAFNSNTLTIGRNGNKIMNSATDMTVGVQYFAGTLTYVNATKGWIFTS